MLNAYFTLAQHTLDAAAKKRAYDMVAALVPVVKAEKPKASLARA